MLCAWVDVTLGLGGVEVLDRMEGQGGDGRDYCCWVFRMASKIGLGKMFWLSFK